MLFDVFIFPCLAQEEKNVDVPLSQNTMILAPVFNGKQPSLLKTDPNKKDQFRKAARTFKEIMEVYKGNYEAVLNSASSGAHRTGEAQEVLGLM
jgi:hypothetical protein